MALLDIHGHLIDGDDWQAIPDDANICTPEYRQQSMIVPIDMLYRKNADCLHHISHAGRLGVTLNGDTDLAQLESCLPQLSLIVIEFPRFSDGRGFSQSRTLRHQKHYHGELRAKGWLLPDQRGFLAQCGFDSIDVDDNIYLRHGAQIWHAPDAVDLSYQQGFTLADKTSILQKRWQEKANG